VHSSIGIKRATVTTLVTFEAAQNGYTITHSLRSTILRDTGRTQNQALIRRTVLRDPTEFVSGPCSRILSSAPTLSFFFEGAQSRLTTTRADLYPAVWAASPLNCVTPDRVLSFGWSARPCESGHQVSFSSTARDPIECFVTAFPGSRGPDAGDSPVQ
jgi:hypothetical protein